MPPAAIDPVVEANRLANLFYSNSQAVDAFRLAVLPAPSREDMGRLKDEAQGLDDRAHSFTAQAIGATLNAVQGDLDRIKFVTGQASEQLSKLNDVSEAITLATSVLSLGTAIAAGDPATILAAGEALAKLVTA